MMYLLHRESSDPAMLKTLLKEVDEVMDDDLPAYETHKKLKFAEAW